MKRFIFTILLMSLAVVFMEPAEVLFSKFIRADQPEAHEIQSGEWLSKLAQKYYGDLSYWKELALVNRAPNSNLIIPGEKVIIPSFAAVEKIRKSRTLSAVNRIIGKQESILAGALHEPQEPVAKVQSERQSAPVRLEPKTRTTTAEVAESRRAPQKAVAAQKPDEKFSLASTPVLSGLAVLVVVAAIAIFMYVRKRRRDAEIAYYGDSGPVNTPVEEDGDKGVYFFDDFKKQNRATKDQKDKEVAVAEK